MGSRSQGMQEASRNWKQSSGSSQKGHRTFSPRVLWKWILQQPEGADSLPRLTKTLVLAFQEQGHGNQPKPNGNSIASPETYRMWDHNFVLCQTSQSLTICLGSNRKWILCRIEWIDTLTKNYMNGLTIMTIYILKVFYLTFSSCSQRHSSPKKT